MTEPPSVSEIVKSKPIGEGLNGIHASFKLVCNDLGVPASVDAVQQVIDEGNMKPNFSCARTNVSRWQRSGV
jgi:hypothetical protein